MRIVSFDGGFGELDGEVVHPMQGELAGFLADPATAARSGDPVPVTKLSLRAPVPRPGKILCIGLNYRDHAAEAGLPVPSEPVLFAKFANSVVGDGAVVEVPAATRRPDWEAELGVVIGRRGKDIAAGAALHHVAGYVCANDLSARDLQRSNGGQWVRGKAIDGFLPTGPALVTPDEVGDPQALGIRCRLNGELVQDSSTSQMIFGVAELIAELSRTITLEPGDLIVTGTPPGVGFARTPPRYLQDGDEVVVEIDRLGTLATTIRRPHG